MSLFSIALFFMYLWGFGFSLGRVVRESEGFLERNIMRLGIGLCTFIVVGIVFNALRVPMDWRIFLVLSLICPLYCLARRRSFKIPVLRVKISDIYALAALAIFAVVFFMYASGSFRYPYLEDDDPWSHARGVKYIAVEKTAFANENLNSQYIDPYPPGYDMLFGILHQLPSSVSWTIKFFNSLLISLSVLFFYFFAKEFSGSRSKALFATLVLSSVPAYMSHFIWAPALAMVVFFPSMYSFEMVRHGRGWYIPSAIGVASILLVHPTHAAKLLVLIMIYLGFKLVSLVKMRSWLSGSAGFFAVIAGLFISLFWWGFKWKTFAISASGGLRGGIQAGTEAIQKSPNILVKFFTLVVRALNPDSGTATRVYTLRDLALAQSFNMINNPVGLGFFVFVLFSVGIFSALLAFAKTLPKPKFLFPIIIAVVLFSAVFLAPFVLRFQQDYLVKDGPLRPQNWLIKPSYFPVFGMTLILVSAVVGFILACLAVLRRPDAYRVYLAVLIGWLLFAFLGVNNKTFNLPVGLFAFRFWMVLAVPVALLAAEGLFAAVSVIRRLPAANFLKVALILFFVVGVLLTSAKPKYDLNTSCWYSGAFWSGSFVQDPASGCTVPSELMVYNWLKTLPRDTKVLTLSYPDQVIGFDKYSCGWCAAESELRNRFDKQGLLTASDLHEFMAANGYEYFIIGGIEARNYGVNKTVDMIEQIVSSGFFQIAQQGESAIVFRRI